MKMFILSALMLCLPAILKAQGSWETVGPYGGWIHDMEMDGTGRILAAASFGGIYRSSDNADSWEQIYNDTLIFDPRTIAINSSGHIFVGGDGTYLNRGFFRSTDDGASWQAITNSVSFRLLRDLLVLDNGDILAATAGNGLYRSTDNGATFASVAGLASSYVEDIEMNGTGDLFVCTSFDNQYVHRSTDGGVTWQVINSGIGATGSITYDLYVTDSDELYLSTGSAIYRSVDNGDSWIDLLAPDASYSGVVVVPNDIMYAAASSIGGSIGGGVFRSTDNGASWSSETGLPERSVSELIQTSAGSVLLGGQGQGIYRRDNPAASTGFDWQQRVGGMVNTYIVSIVYDSTRGYVYAGTRHSGVFRSTDAGQTWEHASSGIYDYEFLYDVALNPTNGDVYASGAYGGVYQSTDQGTSWSSVYDFGGTKIACNSQGHIFNGLGSFMYRSTNNGMTWTSASLSPVTRITDISFDDDTVYVATGYGSGFGTNNGVYRSTDNGTGWHPFNDGLTNLNVTTVSVSALPAVATLTSAICPPKKCGTYGNGVFSLNGNTWSQQGLDNFFIRGLRQFAGLGGEASLVVAGSLLFLEDEGCAWRAIGTGLQSEHSGLALAAIIPAGVPDNQILAGTTGRGIYRGTGVIAHAAEPAQVPAQFSLAQNYPNPFNPSTKIAYTINARMPILLMVYDVLGREVETLVDEVKDAGTHEVIWDAKGRASGVYYYRLSTGTSVQTRKLVLMR